MTLASGRIVTNESQGTAVNIILAVQLYDVITFFFKVMAVFFILDFNESLLNWNRVGLALPPGGKGYQAKKAK